MFSEKYRCLRSLLIEARRSRRLTQAEVAKRLDRPQSFVSKYESGERRLDVIEFLEVAAALGVEGEELLTQVQVGATRPKGGK
jgi:transcriptional regulator with XRE-family HTH domain